MRAAVPLSTAMQAKIDRLNLVLAEGLSGVRVIRAFDRGDRQRERFDAANLDLTSVSKGTHTVYCSIEGHRAAGMEATLEVK